jgi:uncharacterized protein (DUF2236 family)
MTTPGILHRVSSERVVLLGWSRAILMQLAHPLIAAGVIEHSEFRGGAVAAAVRLHHTVKAMLHLVFGNSLQRHEALERIRAIHRRVHGTLPEPVGRFPAGTRYSAEDPALLLWVHATLVDSTAEAYLRLVGSLSASELDAVCHESIPTLVDLGGDASSAPATWPALREYMRSIEQDGILALTPTARDLAHAVLSPRAGGLPIPFTGLSRLVTIGLLPPRFRDLYGFAWDSRREKRFARALHVIAAARRASPQTLSQWPQARARRS